MLYVAKFIGMEKYFIPGLALTIGGNLIGLGTPGLMQGIIMAQNQSVSCNSLMSSTAPGPFLSCPITLFGDLVAAGDFL